jgi:branched-chain amino acid transport system ATP-binding protein
VFLEVRDLRIHYGRAEALKGVSLSVNEGEIIAIVGANGAGKTTILRAISGLIRPTSGEIWFCNKRIDGKPPQEIVKKGIAHIPEGRMIFAPMTVLDNLKMGAYLRKDKAGIAKDLDNTYSHFGILKEKRNMKAGSLSGGQQQMVATARGLMARPRLLLMDEPSIGLSPLLVKEVGKIISDINKDDVSIILVEQNARMALKLANRAYILEVGSIAFEGDSAQLAKDPRVQKSYLGG